MLGHLASSTWLVLNMYPVVSIPVVLSGVCSNIQTDRDLTDQMGTYGGPHTDCRDCPFCLTCLLPLSDLPADCDPGRIHLLPLGAYFVLDPWIQIFMSGLLYHGGTPPLAPDGVDIPEWATRALLVSYPHTSLVVGNVKHAFAALPHELEPFHITQEMTGAPHKAEQVYSRHSNFANDGIVVMEPEAHFRFFSRGLLQSNFFMLEQCPAELDIQIDREAWLRSITMRGPDGGRISAADWAEGPDGNVKQRYNETHQKIQQQLLVDMYERYSRFIPTCSSTSPYREADISSAAHSGRLEGEVFDINGVHNC